MSATIDFQPAVDGLPYDPVANGGGVDRLRLFMPGTATPVVDVGPAVRTAAGVYRFTFSPPVDGIYSASITWRETADSPPNEDSDEVVQFPLLPGAEPVPEGYVVAADVVARRAGFTFPLSPRARQVLLDAMTDAQADVEGYLGCGGLLPRTWQEVAYRYGMPGDPKAYRLEHGPVLSIVSEEPVEEYDGWFTVVYTAGMDARTIEPIARYVRSHAASLARQHPLSKTFGVTRGIRNVSADGQSISYDNEGGASGSGAVGSLPSLDSLKGFACNPPGSSGKVKVFQRRGAPYPSGDPYPLAGPA